MYSKAEVEKMIAEARGGREAAAAETVEKFEKMLRGMAKIEESRPLTPGELMWRTTAENFIETEKRKKAPRPLTLQDFGGGGNYGRGFTEGPFRSFGEQMQAVMRAGIPGGSADPRLFEVRAATGLGETIPSDGGFLVQTDFSNELVKAVYQTGILSSRCRRFQISGNSNSIKLNAFDETSRVSTRFGGIQSYWIDEAAEKTASKPKFRQMDLNLKKLVGLCYASDEVLADAVALEQIIQSAFVSEFGFKLDDAIINGTGAGQPLGILNSGCLVSVAKESGQKAATIVYENVVKMYARLLPQSEPNAIWLINRNILPQLYAMNLAVGTAGVPVFMPANGLAGLPYNTLFGRPVIAIEQAATLGTVGDIILADLSSYILAEKGGIETAMSIHVQFKYDESVFRFVMRVDGQPMYSSALTAYKGPDTLSPFVVLDTRA